MKSWRKPLVSDSYGWSASIAAMLWPNSWKNVSTSPWVSSAGLPGAGCGQLPTIALWASRTLPSGSTRRGTSGKLAKWSYLPGRG